jgi:fucose permease
MSDGDLGSLLILALAVYCLLKAINCYIVGVLDEHKRKMNKWH